MTNCAKYKRRKWHHIPWRSDICTLNQLKAPPGWLSRPFQTKNSKQRCRASKWTFWTTWKETCPIKLLSNRIHDAISGSNFDTISMTISRAVSEAIANSNPERISESDSDHSHLVTLLQEGGSLLRLCEAVGDHLSSRYVAQVHLSISSHICSR